MQYRVLFLLVALLIGVLAGFVVGILTFAGGALLTTAIISGLGAFGGALTLGVLVGGYLGGPRG